MPPIKIAALIAVFCLALLAPPSQAATTADEQAPRDWLTSYGVPSELQQYAIDKVKNDETLDADKEGSAPIITEDRTSGTSIIHVKIYADGSFTADQEYTASSQATGHGSLISGAQAVIRPMAVAPSALSESPRTEFSSSETSLITAVREPTPGECTSHRTVHISQRRPTTEH
ncbi:MULTISPECIES: hypothetical protein [unclassified Actinomyces]|uniref:hypothetical protein n=1 Tax=unclassified Actinomyces TaxID=2609248 RepID=UPI0011BEF471|nr:MULTISPECIES: hypothetical protein [unclassified Actinomyces]